ncbi:MAG: hypothetical protein ABSG79_13845 [Bryobacteraceae bacterium]|jgi:hypothetical protein
MIPNTLFLKQPPKFWAYVRSISQRFGYSVRKKGQIKVPSIEQMAEALNRIGLDSGHLTAARADAPPIGEELHAYFQYRAETLNTFVEPRLMNKDSARELFLKMKEELSPKIPIPMNKQKGDKKAPAYMTAIVNMLIEANAGGMKCDYDPRALTTVTRNGEPLRTLSRRVDGAFPCAVNPIAVWEIKEYYYTKTFGSRVADGVYETLVDGMELEELRVTEGVNVLHYLMVDDHFTWWKCGRSYLCRILDMLHMGYIDEVLFGSEAVERLPILVKEWSRLAGER